MARTIQEIEAEILAKKGDYPELASLNNNTPTAIWRLWVYIFAFMHWLLESLWDRASAELEDKANAAISHNTRWYYYQSLLFQFGYNLIWDEGQLKYVYAVEDITARIVKFCSVSVANGGFLQVKVAKDDGNGNPVPLSTAERLAFDTYIDRIHDAGTAYSVISQAADDAIIQANIYYDGTIPLTDIQNNVEVAINDYLKNLTFDGMYRNSALIDAIQKVNGIIDIGSLSVQAKSTLTSYQTVALNYRPNSGYMQVDSTQPLSSTLNYIAE